MPYIRAFLTMLFLAGIVSARALAGPPLICFAHPTGSAASLSWSEGIGWNGALPSYDLSSLVSDSLRLLKPEVPVETRMETIRRAVIYAARRDGLADTLVRSLLARSDDRSASAASRAAALFDAGYTIETVRDAVHMYAVMRATDRDAWMIRSAPGVDGLALIRQAMQLGGTGMDDAVAIVQRARAEER